MLLQLYKVNDMFDLQELLLIELRGELLWHELQEISNPYNSA